MNFEKYINRLPYTSKSRDPETHKAYVEEGRNIHTQFKIDLFDDLGITSHPKAEKLFSKAWDMGHSNGYQEVYNYASDLVELIKD